MQEIITFLKKLYRHKKMKKFIIHSPKMIMTLLAQFQ
ncbi:hypothetical protein ESCOMM283M1_23990 [Escherichia coli]